MKKALALVLAAVLAMGALAGCNNSGNNGGSQAAGLPKNVEIMVPAKAGGGTDVMARALATEVAAQAGSTMTIINNSDGNGVVACETARAAKDDGSTLLQFHTTMLIKTATGIYDKSAAEDFKVIAVSKPAEAVSYVLCTNADSEWDTLDKFLAYAKENEVKMGVETGGMVHILTGILAGATGTKLKYVDAGTDTEKMQALVGHTIDAVLVNVNQASQYIEAGKVNGLAVVGDGKKETRSSVLPDIKNFEELGVEGVTWSMYNFILGPKSMSDDLAKKIHDLYQAAAETENVNKILEPAGMAMHFMAYEEGPAALRAMQETLNKVVEELGLKQ
ncbi:MAG: tripartite tricarboxylate transporter substrate binding protein [Lachnospiraceae bacterium]|nr:tripartite tricarboxylate transporter substrate binding protein [Lachnospiraceae bacterium]